MPTFVHTDKCDGCKGGQVTACMYICPNDLMKLDEAGFFHFVDRIGDTFRWKGENVATSEVDEAVAQCPGVVDVATYGVVIPGCDGRAGMVAIVAGDGPAARTLTPATRTWQ